MRCGFRYGLGLGLGFAATCAVLAAAPARADLCDNVKNAEAKDIKDETKRDVDFFERLFPDKTYRGNRRWNEIVLQCNRKRDTKGNAVAKATAAIGSNADKSLLERKNLEPKVIRGHYNFLGILAFQLKYVYVLSKTAGVWTMIIPYNAEIIDLVANRVDFYSGSRWRDPNTNVLGSLTNQGHAWTLFDASQVNTTTDPKTGAKTYSLKPSPSPIAITLCRAPEFFPGANNKYDGQNDADAYKRDPENKHINLGKIQYGYDKDGPVYEGCRVDENLDLFRIEPVAGRVVKVKPKDFVLDNFVHVAESYWSTPAFQLKLLMKGRNDAAFPKSTRDLLREGDHLTVRFATKFPSYDFNQMYKSNILQFNNFSTMTSDGIYQHEVGHAFGLDDEYGGDKKSGDLKINHCMHSDYAAFEPEKYVMCIPDQSYPRSIYQYIAVSRYVTKQSECQSDGDCDRSEYCDKGTISVGKNQCAAKKVDNETCDSVGGGHQCKGGYCKYSRCYTPSSVPIGGICYVDDACKVGKCSSVDGTKGTCVCKKDVDCGDGKWCDAGLDAKINVCRDKLKKGEKCGKAGSFGNDHKCKSGECSGFPKYECK